MLLYARRFIMPNTFEVYSRVIVKIWVIEHTIDMQLLSIQTCCKYSHTAFSFVTKFQYYKQKLGYKCYFVPWPWGKKYVWWAPDCSQAYPWQQLTTHTNYIVTSKHGSRKTACSRLALWKILCNWSLCTGFVQLCWSCTLVASSQLYSHIHSTSEHRSN